MHLARPAAGGVRGAGRRGAGRAARADLRRRPRLHRPGAGPAGRGGRRAASRPAAVAGHAIPPARLRDLLRRIGVLGLTTPDGGELALALTDADGALVATPTLAQLQRKVRAGEGADPPPDTDADRATAARRRFLGTRDGCRHPFCSRRAGWADHAQGGRTGCANPCCLCRTHHRLKTLLAGWLFAMEPDGTLHVTSPAGITRTTRPRLHAADHHPDHQRNRSTIRRRSRAAPTTFAPKSRAALSGRAASG
ncbi:hypothetical protein ACI8AF_14620 [Blastococcus sp. SYSU D00669]